MQVWLCFWFSVPFYFTNTEVFLCLGEGNTHLSAKISQPRLK